jgi:hypothetical protein
MLDSVVQQRRKAVMPVDDVCQMIAIEQKNLQFFAFRHGFHHRAGELGTHHPGACHIIQLHDFVPLSDDALRSPRFAGRRGIRCLPFGRSRWSLKPLLPNEAPTIFAFFVLER